MKRLLLLLCIVLNMMTGCAPKVVRPEIGEIAPPPDMPMPEGFNTEEYAKIDEDEFLDALSNPLSTFSIDVDTASYSNVRRYLDTSELPPQDAVRIEEMINYFDYDYPEPTDEHPFSVITEHTACPWSPTHQLVLIGLQGRHLAKEALPDSNLVFLLDVSGSMDQSNKLPLLKEAFRMLVEELDEDDSVAIVVYAGAAGLVLEPTLGNDRSRILSALNELEAGGSTAGGRGIELAYEVALENYVEGANNRVILATDGDFNVGPSSDGALIRLIEKKRDQGIYLTVLGFGTGNYQDAKMEQLADKGNGNAAYIDNVREAEKVLVSEMAGTLVTIAKDVKLQVEFNPTKVKGYRLVGYENRKLAKEDFADDTKDAGELGVGHSVTALYEIIPVGADEPLRPTVELKYQKNVLDPAASDSDELLTLKLRYKQPKGGESVLLTYPIRYAPVSWAQASMDTHFAAAVAEFGLLLRDSPFKGEATYEQVIDIAQASRGEDLEGYRAEFVQMVKTSQRLGRRND